MNLVNHIIANSFFDSPHLHSGSTPATPQKDKAFNMICKEEGLSPHSVALAQKIFCGSAELAHEYLSFDVSQTGMHEACSYWLSDELTHVQGL